VSDKLTPESMREHGNLERFLKILRGAGVAKFRGGLFVEGWMERWDVDVSFFPSEPPAPPVDKSAEVDPELCRCHHPKFQHEAGLCLMGCDVEQCAPEEK
jgi:hypothetical protein